MREMFEDDVRWFRIRLDVRLNRIVDSFKLSMRLRSFAKLRNDVISLGEALGRPDEDPPEDIAREDVQAARAALPEIREVMKQCPQQKLVYYYIELRTEEEEADLDVEVAFSSDPSNPKVIEARKEASFRQKKIRAWRAALEAGALHLGIDLADRFSYAAGLGPIH